MAETGSAHVEQRIQSKVERRALLEWLALQRANPAGQVSTADFARLVLAATSVPTASDEPALIDLLDVPRESRAFVGACLIRLLVCRSDALDDSVEVKHRILSSIDKLLAAPDFVRLGYDPQLPTHQRIDKLVELVLAAEADLEEALTHMTSVPQILHQRGAYSRAMNASMAKLAIRPLLTDAAVVSSQTVFESIVRYEDARPAEMRSEYERTKNVIANFLNSIDPGELDGRLLRPLGDRALAALDEAFMHTAQSKPGVLTVTSTEKKYPLNEVGRVLDVALAATNSGEGTALDATLTLVDAENISLDLAELPLGNVDPGTIVVPIRAETVAQSSFAMILGSVRWRNADGTRAGADFNIEIAGWDREVDWSGLDNANPYGLEPVESEEQLVGRDSELAELQGLAEASPIGNAYVYGQKRVGKTSIIKTLASTLEAEHGHPHCVIYLEGGDYVAADASATIANLGSAIAKRVLRYGGDRLSGIAIPEFRGTLSPLGEFLEDARARIPDLLVHILLDEFDELPLELYQKGQPGDSFFLSMRSLSSKPYVGFVLVGGEKMEFILANHGQQFNKFDRFRIDYFSRITHWQAFRDLVRRPVQTWLEITEDALISLYELSAGHPYFTKLVCREILRLSRERRDSHVTVQEVGSAATLASERAGVATFQHFWDDGIFQTGPQREEISLRRRKVLLGLANCLRQNRDLTAVNIGAEAARYGCDPLGVETDLNEFERRRVLNKVDGSYSCGVRLFAQWLRDHGAQEIITETTDPGAFAVAQAREARDYVRPDELEKLVASWDIYRGRVITAQDTRSWLDQFGGSFIDQRLMFRILQAVRFVRRDDQRRLLRDAHGIVQRALAGQGKVHHRTGQQRKTGHLIVSYLDGPARSGAVCARWYADENAIFNDNVVERQILAKVLPQFPALNGLVFVDDFVGTGSQASGDLRGLAVDVREELARRELPVFLISLLGFDSGVDSVRRAAVSVGLDINIHLCETLTAADRCFSEESSTFPDQAERQRAHQIVFELGNRLDKRQPLGHCDSQALVVFSEGCPNNTLPILWKEHSSWVPLFPRG